MTDQELAALAQAVAVVIRGELAKHMGEMSKQVAELAIRATILEAREPRDGRDGLNIKGDTGPQGDPGPKGDPGTPGADGKDGENGSDGRDGKDGRDGENGVILGPTDIKALDVEDGGRTFALTFGDEVTLRVKTALLLDRGVWVADRIYEAGDGVTRDGSFWIAQTETLSQPGTDASWRLAVKRGRDGKPGKDGKNG